MKILLLGKYGQIGWELQRTLAPLGVVTALGRDELDLTNIEAIRCCVKTIKPELIVNAAAYTAVDRAEEEPDTAMAVNGVAPGVLAEEAKKFGAAVVHYSTDYVFDGEKGTPYIEDDTPKPINVYGKTKLAGEWAVQAAGVPYLIFRTSWIYGWQGSNFLLRILKLARERQDMRVVNDQIGTPTWCRMVAGATAVALAGGLPGLVKTQGIYHLTAGGCTTWHGFAEAILARAVPDSFSISRLIPILSSQYKTLALRPSFSVLSNTKIKKVFQIMLPDWRQLLDLAIADGISLSEYKVI